LIPKRDARVIKQKRRQHILSRKIKEEKY